MCYNDFNGLIGGKCRVRIRSCGDGWSEDVSTFGEILTTEDSVGLKYTLNSDECSLSYKDGRVTQERKGSQNLRLEFCEGRKTFCTIGSGSMTGSFDILTRSIKFFSGKGGFKLKLEYNSGTDGEKISLSLTASKI